MDALGEGVRGEDALVELEVTRVFTDKNGKEEAATWN